jgi:CxxC motif-containing protein (DUF1111 family)
VPSGGRRRRPRWALSALIACLAGSASAALGGEEPKATTASSALPVVASAVARPGAPIAGLNAAEQARFERGRRAFERSYTIADGLGPLFNETGCNRCHNRKGLGGSGFQSAQLAGRAEAGAFDALLGAGGPSLASASVMLDASPDVRRALPDCKLAPDGEPVPSAANVTARRRTTPLFGLGLVDATPDATFQALARKQPAAIRGRAPLVPNLSRGARSVGKFGWKAQAPSLHQFAGMALSVELGVTNPEFPNEQAPLGDATLVAACDLVPGLEADAHEVQLLTAFLQGIAPVPRLRADAAARQGDALFTRIGCDGCHVRQLTSGPSPLAALAQQSYAPFSDFLLHDMGELADGIGSDGDAGPREMRTAPLWGSHLLGGSRLLHDGRAKSFESAIESHAGQGSAARSKFEALSKADQARLIAFLGTL